MHLSTARNPNWSPASGLVIGLLLWLTLTLAALVYAPGLASGFWFDDLAALDELGRYGGVCDWRTLWLYLTSGTADPTGRPLSLLSFLIDGNDWPANSYSFKRTNLGIHLLNGALLSWVLRALGCRAGIAPAPAERAAVLGAALWLLHPLWVSTTLYVVQRQAMLPATFTLMAVLLWEGAWRQLEKTGDGAGLRQDDGRWNGNRHNRLRLAWLLGFVGVGLTSLCAVLSKANGALTPALIALCWWLLYRPRMARLSVAAQANASRLVHWALLGPSVLVVVALLAQIPDAIESATTNRPWTLAERVLSQPRALLDYLGLLWLPRVGSAGLFADDFVVSTGPLTPWTTLPALALVGALIGLALVVHRTKPVLALAIFFFFIGHTVESGWLPLEPYFEHRSYLPALLLFWPLALWLTDASQEKLARLRQGLRWGLPLLVAALTWGRVAVWTNEILLAAHVAAHSQNSPRAQLWLSNREILADRYQAAAQRMQRALLQRPEQTLLAWNLLQAECLAGAARPAVLTLAEQALRSTPWWQRIDYDWLSTRIAISGRSNCPHYSAESLTRLLEAATANPRIADNPDWRQDVLSLRAELALSLRDIDGAERLFRRSLAQQPRPDVALLQAAISARYGHPALGLAHLERYRRNYGMRRPAYSGMARLHQWLLAREGYYGHEMNTLAATLREDLTQLGDHANDADNNNTPKEPIR